MMMMMWGEASFYLLFCRRNVGGHGWRRTDRRPDELNWMTSVIHQSKYENILYEMFTGANKPLIS